MIRIEAVRQASLSPSWPGVPEWLGSLLAVRGVRSAREAELFLHPTLDQLLPPARLGDVEKAVSLLTEARDQGKRAVIYGDYDVDGVCACAILREAFGCFGLSCGVYIPDRHEEGYGLNLPAVEALAKEYQLLVTVDCGITSVREAAAAREMGMQVIITDHHRHLEALPPADAVISPLLSDYPFPFLCGAGVAWKLALALIGDQTMPLMELAALATIADMVPLTGENRVIAALGLERLCATGRPGLRALMEKAGIRGQVTSEQVAFQIAPRMNACGRLESARIALDMLLSRDREEAEALALKMESLNQQRREEEDFVLKEALSQVRQMDLIDTKAIVVCGEGWNSGVVGLAAGRIAEKYAYPAVALSRQEGLYVGSARSAGQIDIFAALSRCKDLFVKFGGHRQAAGLTLPAEHLPEFRRRLSDAVSEQTGGLPPQATVLCDGEMSLGQVTPETVRWLARLEPFGIGNPSPRFLCEGAEALYMRAVGAEGRHLRCTLRQGSDLRDAICFGGGDYAGNPPAAYRLALTPTLNEYRGRVSAECRIEALQLLPETLPEEPLRELAALCAEPMAEMAADPVAPEALDGLMGGGQGTLLVCRCRETALDMMARYPQADFALGEARDPRAFHTVLLYGASGRVSAPFRQVVLCDGEAGDADAWRRACPGAKICALQRSRALKKLLGSAFVGIDGLRACYQALRRGLPSDLPGAAALFGLTPLKSAFALRVFSQIDLMDVSFSPFRAALLPAVKRSPEDSALFRLARQGMEEEDGLYSL